MQLETWLPCYMRWVHFRFVVHVFLCYSWFLSLSCSLSFSSASFTFLKTSSLTTSLARSSLLHSILLCVNSLCLPAGTKQPQKKAEWKKDTKDEESKRDREQMKHDSSLHFECSYSVFSFPPFRLRIPFLCCYGSSTLSILWGIPSLVKKFATTSCY